MPATLALLGLAGAEAARAAVVTLMPYLLSVSVLLLGRAHYLVHARKRGRPWARCTVWAATLVMVILWVPRLFTGLP